MYNRFKFERDFFKANFKDILDRIDFMRNNSYKKIFHIIVPDLELEFMENNIFNLENEYDPALTHIYNREVIVNSPDFEIEYFDYIKDLIDSSNEEINIMFYNQRINGWNSNSPTANLVVYVDKNYEMVFDYDKKQKIGNFMGRINFPKVSNVFIGNRKCSKCLNCLCDITKTEESFFLVDKKECSFKMKLRKSLPKEVTEVSKEEYITIIEYLYSINKNNQTDHNILAEGLTTIQEAIMDLRGEK